MQFPRIIYEIFMHFFLIFNGNFKDNFRDHFLGIFLRNIKEDALIELILFSYLLSVLQISQNEK